MHFQIPQHAGHNASMANITRQVRTFYDSKIPYRVYHGSTNSTRTSLYRQDNIIDISSMKRVLEINVNDKVAFVEPNVAMDQLVNETLKYGLLPPVVMEFLGLPLVEVTRACAAKVAHTATASSIRPSRW